MNADSFMEGLFPQLGLFPENSSSKNYKCGFTLVPDPKLGKGYVWTYPVNPYFSITIYHLSYYKEMHYRYHHPAMLVVSLSSPIVAKAVTGKSMRQREQLIGYHLSEGYHEYTLPAASSIDNIGIAFTPEFYSTRLSMLYGHDFSILPSIVSLMDGTVNIPAVVFALKDIAVYKPTTAESRLFYEAKALELIAGLIEWHTQESSAVSVKNICLSDRKAIHELNRFIQQHYCDSLDVQSMAKICHMSKSKLSVLFRTIYGVSIIEFINNLRVERAKELLTYSSCQIKEISAILGYAQQSSFTFLFKQKVGMSPRDYRKKNLFFS